MPKTPNFELFRNSRAKRQSETQSRKKLASLVLFKPFKEFFQKTSFFTKNPSFERFENSWVILTFETHYKWNEPCLLILKNFKFFFMKTHPLPQKKTKILTALRNLKQFYALRRIVVRNYQFYQFWKRPRTFWEKPMNFSKKNPTFECLDVSQLKIPHETLFKKTRPCLATLKKFRFFLEKKTHLSSQENLNSERFCFENS